MITDDRRTVEVPRRRLGRWLINFTERHGEPVRSERADQVVLRAPDGAVAEIAVPFAPLTGDLVEHVLRDHRVGIVLVRRGGYAVGIAEGEQLIASKVGTGYVQGTTKAGGWSQQRYARRRANQTDRLWGAATEVAVDLLADAPLVAIVTGGDRTAATTVLADPRLARVAGLAWPRTYPVPDPRLRVLQAFPETFLAVRITLNELA